jgi:hypothetical protein
MQRSLVLLFYCLYVFIISTVSTVVACAGKSPKASKEIVESSQEPLKISDQDPAPKRWEPPSNPRSLVLPCHREWMAKLPVKGDPTRYKYWRQRRRIHVGHSHLSTAQFLGGQRFILAMSQSETRARVYDRTTGKLVANHPVVGLTPETFSRGAILGWPGDVAQPLFIVGHEGGLAIVSALSGETVRPVDEEPSWEMRWSPDERILVRTRSMIPAQKTEMTFFHGVAYGYLKKLGKIAFSERADGWALSRDNRYLAVVFFPSNMLEIIDLHTGENLWRVEAPKYAGDVDFSPDDRLVAVDGDHLVLIAVSFQ